MFYWITGVHISRHQASSHELFEMEAWCFYSNNYCSLRWQKLFNTLKPSDDYMCQLTYHHWFRQWPVAWSGTNHYLNQWWHIVDLSLSKQIPIIYYSYFTNFHSRKCIWKYCLRICKMSAILSWPQWVDKNATDNEQVPRLSLWHYFMWQKSWIKA